MSSSNSPDPVFSPEIIKYHRSLLGIDAPSHPNHDPALASIIASSALQHLSKDNTSTQDADTKRDGDRNVAPPLKLQYGLLAGFSESIQSIKARVQEGQEKTTAYKESDPRLFFNITPPSSTFICGSQGSGKSHTLSCMLEACLIPSSKLGRLPNPLTGLVFHYDTFISDVKGQPCEAAFLASNADVSVRVRCAPTNFASITPTYANLNVTIEPLQIDQSHLDTKRMMDLMAVTDDDVPLYMKSVKRILREMRIAQQAKEGSRFDYREFRRRIDGCGFTPGQMGPLSQRLNALESFMPAFQTKFTPWGNKTENGNGTDWKGVRGPLTIVNLSCPCISPATACLLFNICLEIFLQPHANEANDARVGRVVALDEAHKYMTKTPEFAVFTETLLRAVRLQSHLGARISVSTQEPTVSTALLDLCSTTIVHRFTSKGHLAAGQKDHDDFSSSSESPGDKKSMTLFERIVGLRVGEALLFAPSAIVGVRDSNEEGRQSVEYVRLGGRNLKITVRGRLTDDGGKSILSQ